MMRVNLASALFRHGSRKSFFDERAVIPIGSYNEKFGVTLSLPSIVGREGVVRTFEPEMSREERQALESSARRLKEIGEPNRSSLMTKSPPPRVHLQL